GSVCISGATYDLVRKVLLINFADLGLQQVKNIQEPVRAFEAHPYRLATQSIEGLQSEPLDADKALEPPTKPSIAVLPFTNMSSDPEQEYFADGITEDIITELSRFKGLLVIARNSTFT